MTKRKQSDPRAAMDEIGWLSEQLGGPLINLHLIGVVEGASAAQQGRAKGGPAAAKARTEKWHAKCEAAARQLLAEGRDPRDLAAILAKRYKCDNGTIRRVLKKAGIR